MVIDIYYYFKNRPGFNKLIGEDYLIIEYKSVKERLEGDNAVWMDCYDLDD